MAKAIISPEARQDLLEIWEYIAEHNIDAADRVRDAAFEAFDRLAQMPRMGTGCRFKIPLLEGLRLLPLTEFPNYLIFYRPVTGGVEIVRVLHGARDLPEFFGD